MLRDAEPMLLADFLAAAARAGVGTAAVERARRLERVRSWQDSERREWVALADPDLAERRRAP